MVLLSHLVANFLAIFTPQLHFNKEKLMSDIADHHYWGFIFGVFLRFVTDGHLAVLIFFVLSGYALSAAHLVPPKRNLGLAAAARYFRLMIPILFTSCIAYLLLKFGLFFNVEATRAEPAYANWLGTFYNFDANFLKALKFSLHDVFLKYDDAGTYNSSLWTMRTELYGSFFIYLYLAVFRKTEKIQWKIIGILGLALYLFETLYACFVAGYVIAELNKKYQSGDMAIYKCPSQIVLLCIFAIAAIASTFFRGNDKITFLIATAIVFSVSFSSWLKSFFSTRISEFLGKISFPLYLIQILVICSWSSYLAIHLPRFGLSNLHSCFLIFFSTVTICLIASIGLIPVEKTSVVLSKKIARLILRGAESGVRNLVRLYPNPPKS